MVGRLENEMSTNNIKPLQVAENKFAALVSQFARELPAQIELCSIQAKIRREKFKAYMREGFTEAQALELVKAEVR